MTTSPLTPLLQGPDRIGAVAGLLDGLDQAGRLAALGTLTRAEQRQLWNKARESAPLTLEHFVPGSRPPLQAVHHFGRNTLPLPRKHRLFEKRFVRPDSSGAEENGKLFGYNQAATLKLIGPGYFVAHATAGNRDWEERGAIVIDYFMTPDGAVARDWPRVVPNTVGLQRFVYHGTRDFMRGVSRHVSIGAAYKGEKPLDHYFVLCRLDAA
jgi:hypothetical protein